MIVDIVILAVRDKLMKTPVRGRHLSPAKVRALLTTGDHRLDNELSRELMCTAYTLAGGESLLVFETGKGLLYPNRDELARTHRVRVEKAKRQFLESQPILPDAEHFVERVPEFLAALPDLIGIPGNLLDKSESSLSVIDRAIRKTEADRMLEPEVFSALTAYVGEVICELTQGSWATARGRDGRGVPHIVDESGHRYLPCRFYKELLEYGRRASTRAFVAGIVRIPPR